MVVRVKIETSVIGMSKNKGAKLKQQINICSNRSG